MSVSADDFASAQHGGPLKIRIEFSKDTDVEKEASHLSRNVAVEDITVFFSSTFSKRPTRDAIRAVELASRCPSLRRLAFVSEGYSYYALPVAALSAALNLARQLSSLELDLIEISGDANDFLALQESFRNNASLRSVRSTCWLSEEFRLNMTLDPFAAAISASPTIESLYFQPTFVPGGLAVETVTNICASQSLRTLNLQRCDITDEHVETMARQLEHNASLRDLRMSCRLGEDGSRALALCLRNNSSLESLYIHNESMETLADLDEEEDYIVDIATALKENTTLKSFSLHGTTTSRISQAAFAAMLCENCVLTNLSLVDMGEFKQEMDMYLTLNANGRARLLQYQNATRNQWIETLILVADDISCSFYVLCRNPSLCDVHNSSASSPVVQANQSTIGFRS